jgi:hemerythrin
MAEESKRIDVLNELNRYATYHFISEEEMMNQYDYGELKAHASEHSFLKGKLVTAIKDSKKGVLQFESFIMFLIKWFTDHTTVTDKKMTNFITKVRL